MCRSKKILSVLLSLLLVFIVMPVSIFADSEPVPYLYHTYDKGMLVTYEDVCTDYKIVDADTRSLNDGWYVVNKDVTIDGELTSVGNVNIILCDGYTLTIQNKGIVNLGALNIYGQEHHAGKIICEIPAKENDKPAIQNESGSSIFFHGGKLYAKTSHQSATIGSRNGENGGSLTVYDGEIVAENIGEGAAIGGSYRCNDAGDITVYGGVISAKSNSGSGIGGGAYGNGARVYIGSGMVTAEGGVQAIGSGNSGDSEYEVSSLTLGRYVKFVAGDKSDELSLKDETDPSLIYELRYFQAISTHHHQWSDWVIRKEPTCTERGQKEKICSSMDAKEVAYINVIPHTPVMGDKLDPTCTQDGHDYEIICSVCGTNIAEGNLIQAVGHDWSQWLLKTEPACRENGLEERICSICKKTENRYLEPLGHIDEDGDLYCDRCKEYLNYHIIRGDNAKVYKSSDMMLTIASDAEFSKFKEVLIDNKPVGSDSYIAESGSTVITLSSDYLENLSLGEHICRIVSADGYAECKFTVLKKQSNQAPVPYTVPDTYVK